MEPIKGIYATISFLVTGKQDVAILFGNPERCSFIKQYQETHGTKKTLQLIVSDLGFNLDFPFPDEVADKTEELKQENQEIWTWINRPQIDDPVELVFEGGLYLKKVDSVNQLC